MDVRKEISRVTAIIQIFLSEKTSQGTRGRVL